MTTRNATIDIARAIGIILVVFGHNWIVLHDRNELFRIVFSFHVPLFFFLSGLFLKDSQHFNKFIRSKADVLLKPYLVILISIGIFKLFKTTIIGLKEPSLLTYFLGVFYASGATITIAWRPLWFLPHLFLASVISILILRMTIHLKYREMWLYSISLILLSTGIYTIGILLPTLTNLNQWSGLPWSFDLMPIDISFILCGFLLREQVKSMNFRLLSLSIVTILFMSLHYYFNETMDLNLRIYGNPLISSLQAVTGIYIILSISSFLQRFTILRQWLTYLSSGSLFILIFHSVIQELTFLGLSRISYSNYLNGIVSLVVAILVPLIILEITKRQRFLAVLLLPHKLQVSYR
jgi:polysaccharide biosynthesis protein PslL